MASPSARAALPIWAYALATACSADALLILTLDPGPVSGERAAARSERACAEHQGGHGCCRFLEDLLRPLCCCICR